MYNIMYMYMYMYACMYVCMYNIYYGVVMCDINDMNIYRDISVCDMMI